MGKYYYYRKRKSLYPPNVDKVESLTVQENGTYTAPQGKAYSPVVVNVAGSGNENVFDTATATLANNSDAPLCGYCPHIATVDSSNAAVYGYIELVPGETMAFTVPLYGLGCAWFFGGLEPESFTGSVIVQDGVYVITGDCTITFGGSGGGK